MKTLNTFWISLFFTLFSMNTFSQTKTGQVIHYEIEGIGNFDGNTESTEFQEFTNIIYEFLQNSFLRTFKTENISPANLLPILTKNAQASKQVKKLKKKEIKKCSADFNFKVIISLTETGTLIARKKGEEPTNRFLFIRVGVFDREGTLLYLSEEYEFGYSMTTSDNFDGRVYNHKRMKFDLEDFRNLFNQKLQELTFISADILDDY